MILPRDKLFTPIVNKDMRQAISRFERDCGRLNIRRDEDIFEVALIRFPNQKVDLYYSSLQRSEKEGWRGLKAHLLKYTSPNYAVHTAHAFYNNKRSVNDLMAQADIILQEPKEELVKFLVISMCPEFVRDKMRRNLRLEEGRFIMHLEDVLEEYRSGNNSNIQTPRRSHPPQQQRQKQWGGTSHQEKSAERYDNRNTGPVCNIHSRYGIKAWSCIPPCIMQGQTVEPPPQNKRGVNMIAVRFSEQGQRDGRMPLNKEAGSDSKTANSGSPQSINQVSVELTKDQTSAISGRKHIGGVNKVAIMCESSEGNSSAEMSKNKTPTNGSRKLSLPSIVDFVLDHNSITPLLVDTGAGVSIIPQHKCLDIFPERGPCIKAFGGSDIKTIGTTTLVINLGFGDLKPHKFIAVDEPNEYLILGIDFLRANSLVPHSDQGKLIQSTTGHEAPMIHFTETGDSSLTLDLFWLTYLNNASTTRANQKSNDA